MPHIALIDDDEDLTELFAMHLKKNKWKVSIFNTALSFLDQLDQHPALEFDLILTDYWLPDQNGLELYEEIRRRGIMTPALLLTAYGDFDVAVRALKSGIDDYMVKPIKPDALLKKVSTYIRQRTLEQEVLYTRLGKLVVAESKTMLDILQKVARLADSRASILFTGESGTGKEVLARAVHQISSRREARFVGVNVSAIPDTLFESEFFGYRKGAFTDAVRDHEGYAKTADQGTLFLDEVGELSPSGQAKLLRLLEDKKVSPLGSQSTFSTDFRLISATNRDLRKAIKAGKFREDLFYRLAVISIHIPALRDRVEDLLPLAHHLLQNLAKEENRKVIGFTPKAQEKILAYSWPGNVRELRNSVHEALLATESNWVEAHHLLFSRTEKTPVQSFTYEEATGRFVRRYFTKLLRATGGNVKQVAGFAGLSRKTVYDILNRYGITPESFRNRRNFKQ